jgi:hypothetical protein
MHPDGSRGSSRDQWQESLDGSGIGPDPNPWYCSVPTQFKGPRKNILNLRRGQHTVFLNSRRLIYKTSIDPKTVSSACLDTSDGDGKEAFKAEGSNKLTVHLILSHFNSTQLSQLHD